MTFSPSAAAKALGNATRPFAPLPADLAPRTETDGAAVQKQRAGTQVLGGFKIGATTSKMQAYLGLAGPAAGFMLARNLHQSGAELHFVDFYRPGVECELAVRLARDLPPAPCSAAEAGKAVLELMAAIEVVENRYQDLKAFGTPSLIADQVFHAAAVLGPPELYPQDIDSRTLAGRITVDGALRGEGLGAELLGDPMAALGWLAGSSVAAAFGGLKAGQVVMLGSVTPPIWLEKPGRIRVEFTRLEPVDFRFV
jgi:2-keto-4-pentenoate hydratase